MDDLKLTIRDIPDFPKKGIIFKDITTLLQDAKSFTRMIDMIANRYIGQRIDKVVGVEARGFLIGAAWRTNWGQVWYLSVSRVNCRLKPSVKPTTWSMVPTPLKFTKTPSHPAKKS